MPLTNNAVVAANDQPPLIAQSHCTLFPLLLVIISSASTRANAIYVETGGTWPVQLVQAALLLNNPAFASPHFVAASC